MNNVIQNIPLIELITSEMHPHLEFQTDNLDNLVNSIKKYGIIEPLLVRPKDNKFEIILGNRRYNAAKQLGMEKVPAIISNINDTQALELIISDNIQRKELSSKEEARLYEKALTLPNINKEQLSINLGIPVDRITSKLELLKKDNSPKINNNNSLPNISEYQNESNSVNNDIINLTELNKEERNEIYMNNNQFMESNNNLNNGVENIGGQNPTFGGRFFPSMEDEPTNMNVSAMNPTVAPANSVMPEIGNNSTNSQLIDLTDVGNDGIAATNLNQSLPPIDNQNITANNIMPPVNEASNISLPNIPGLNQIPGIEQQPTSIEPTMQNQEQQNPIPTLNNNIVDNNILSSPEQGINMPNIPNLDQLSQPIDNIQTNIPGIGELSNQPIPNAENTPIDNMNQPIQGSPISDIPNIEVPGLSNPIPQYNNETINGQEKNVAPVINIIKSLALNLETLGYKINISENDNPNSYSINIEVEK